MDTKKTLRQAEQRNQRSRFRRRTQLAGVTRNRRITRENEQLELLFHAPSIEAERPPFARLHVPTVVPLEAPAIAVLLQNENELTPLEPIRPPMVGLGADAKRCELGHSLSSQRNTGRLRTAGCPVCFPKSFGEEYVRQVMAEMFGAPFPSKRPRELGGLELDGYNEELRLAFEHHGEQHFKETHHFHDRNSPRKTFEAQQERDREKLRICRELGIKLIIVPAVASSVPPRDLVEDLVELLAEQEIFVTPEGIERGASVRYITPPLVQRHERAREIVARKGGRILTVLGEHPYKVDCGKGHVWTVSESGLLQDRYWCAACAGRPELGLEDVQAHLDEAYPGWAVDPSSSYVNNHSSTLKFRCKNGHLVGPTCFRVLSRPLPLICRECPDRRRHTNFSSIERHTQDLEGRPLRLLPGQEWQGNKTKLWYACDACGHEWQAKPNNVVQNEAGCPKCALAAKGDRIRRPIEEVRMWAESRGGLLISTTFKSKEDSLHWRCHKGHDFEATLTNVKLGSWCPHCGKSSLVRLELGSIIAAYHGGRCNQTPDMPVNVPWSWTCREGHDFLMKLTDVRRLRWCKLCAANESRSKSD